MVSIIGDHGITFYLPHPSRTLPLKYPDMLIASVSLTSAKCARLHLQPVFRKRETQQEY
jgi:hypothetical protein